MARNYSNLIRKTIRTPTQLRVHSATSDKKHHRDDLIIGNNEATNGTASAPTSATYLDRFSSLLSSFASNREADDLQAARPPQPMEASPTYGHPSTPTAAAAAAATATTTSTPTMLANSLSSHIIDDCQMVAGGEQNSHQPVNCSSANTNQLIANMNINHEELNFGQFEELWLVKSWQEILFRVSFVIPIVLLGILGNLTIIYSICKFKRFRSKPTNIFILNMAIADLLTTVVCPTAALFTHIYQFYVLGSFLCRFEGFIKITCLLVSAYSLIVLSFDWLLSVVRPCRTRITIRQSWLALVSIWLVSLAMAAPLFLWRRLRERQWRDVMEVWCCELIQYTKYYWVGITFFLIYLPTLIMTIVLVIILAQMDQFETKLRRSRTITTTTTTPATTTIATCATEGSLHSSQAQLTSSSSINMKYRRRIVKILFTYLLTSMICWTPLQFTIIYRHFRSEAVPAAWFFELVFFAQLFASLSSAMNPIIFGFLSQPFRQLVTKSWMFRFFDKMRTTNTTNNRNQQPNNNNHNQNNDHANQIIPMNHQNPAVNFLGRRTSSQQRTSRSRDQDQPKLTIESIEQAPSHHHHHHQSNQQQQHHRQNQQQHPLRATNKRDGVTVSRQSSFSHQAGCSKRLPATSQTQFGAAPSSPASSKQLATTHGHNHHFGQAPSSTHHHNDTKRVSFETSSRERRAGHDNAAFESTADDERPSRPRVKPTGATGECEGRHSPPTMANGSAGSSNGYSASNTKKSAQSQRPVGNGSINITTFKVLDGF